MTIKVAGYLMKKFSLFILLLLFVGCAKHPGAISSAAFRHNISPDWEVTSRDDLTTVYIKKGVQVCGMYACSPEPSSTEKIERETYEAFTRNGEAFHVFQTSYMPVSGKNVRYIVGEWVCQGTRLATRAYVYGGPEGQVMVVAWAKREQEQGYSGVMKEFLDGLEIRN